MSLYGGGAICPLNHPAAPPPLRAIRRLLVWVTFRTNMLRHAYHNMPVFTYMYCAILFRCRGHA